MKKINEMDLCEMLSLIVVPNPGIRYFVIYETTDYSCRCLCEGLLDIDVKIHNDLSGSEWQKLLCTIVEEIDAIFTLNRDCTKLKVDDDFVLQYVDDKYFMFSNNYDLVLENWINDPYYKWNKVKESVENFKKERRNK